MKTIISEKTQFGVDKLKQYGWVMKDEPGDMRIIHKNKLNIDLQYQRDEIKSKILEIASKWSWIAAGVIVVGYRDGNYWVIDGQHRVLAAKRRSDITQLPCIVFQTECVKHEATAFLDLNTGRKPVTAFAKFKALIAAGDDVSCFINKTLESLEITIKEKPTKSRETKSIAWVLKRAKEDRNKFTLVMRVAADISGDMPIKEKLLDGLWYINEHLASGIDDKRFKDRLRSVGAKKLIDAATKASAYFVYGGSKVWAMGMMEEINKGLHNKFELTN